MAKLLGSYIADIFEEETPSGTVNGVNTAFTLASTPAYDSTVRVYLNGLRQRQVNDYTVSGTAITFITAPASGETVYAEYIKDRP